MIWCLSNARSGDLHFGTLFVALRALVREIIPNTKLNTKKIPKNVFAAPELCEKCAAKSEVFLHCPNDVT